MKILTFPLFLTFALVVVGCVLLWVALGSKESPECYYDEYY